MSKSNNYVIDLTVSFTSADHSGLSNEVIVINDSLCNETESLYDSVPRSRAGSMTFVKHTIRPSAADIAKKKLKKQKLSSLSDPRKSDAASKISEKKKKKQIWWVSHMLG